MENFLTLQEMLTWSVALFASITITNFLYSTVLKARIEKWILALGIGFLVVFVPRLALGELVADTGVNWENVGASFFNWLLLWIFTYVGNEMGNSISHKPVVRGRGDEEAEFFDPW